MKTNIIRQFTREMMGSSVAHMTNEQLDAWMEPWRKLCDNVEPGYPAWFVKKRAEVRLQLLSVLRARLAECGGDPS
jgi:hypothetical protein